MDTSRVAVRCSSTNTWVVAGIEAEVDAEVEAGLAGSSGERQRRRCRRSEGRVTRSGGGERGDVP
jgi:hypothetical protein